MMSLHIVLIYDLLVNLLCLHGCVILLVPVDVSVTTIHGSHE